MEKAIPARLTTAEGRKFGLTVGGAFLVLGAILWWRGRPAAPVMGGIGALLALAGLVLPTKLGPVQRAWMGLAHQISRVTTPIFMGAIYFLVLTPVGLVMRAFGRNPMKPVPSSSGYWVPRDATQQVGDMERQF